MRAVTPGRVFWTCVAVVASTAAIGQPPSSVTVRVLTDGKNCIVNAQQMPCFAVGAFRFRALTSGRYSPLTLQSSP